MAKKVSPLLFRVTKFNNYKNIWIWDNKNLNILLEYYKINTIISSILLNCKTIYFNNIYYLYGKIHIKKFNYKWINQFITIYYKNKLNLFIILYSLNTSMLSIQFFKLFIKFHLLKYNSIQHLYNKLSTLLLTEYLTKQITYIGFKIIISGRLNNTNLASSEIFQFGLPLALQKIDMFVFYDTFYLLTKYGSLGIKIWIGKK